MCNKLVQEQRIKDMIGRCVPNMVDSRLNNVLPGMVDSSVSNKLFQQLTRVLPGYLRDSVSMKEVLQNHSDSLNERLESSAKNHLERIVNEKKYHTVNARYFDAFKQRGDQAITTMEAQHGQNLRSMNGKFDAEVQSFQSKTSALDAYKRRTTVLESEVDFLRKVVWGGFLTIAGAALYRSSSTYYNM